MNNSNEQNILSLNEITTPVQKELQYFKNELRDSLRSEVGLINILAKYMIMRKGKHIRPLIMIYSSHVCGGPTEDSYRAAAMIEMLHIAALGAGRKIQSPANLCPYETKKLARPTHFNPGIYCPVQTDGTAGKL